MTGPGPGSSDGRNIDPRLGALGGEASGQRVPGASEGAPVFEPFGRAPAVGSPTGYFDRPILKEPVWIWAVPVYFYAGGAAGASAVLGAVARAADGRALGRLVRTCRWIAAAGTAAGAGLLIYDLGRPERFLNMLRVFRPSSAMNLGSWILVAAGSTSGASAVLSEIRPLRALGDTAGYAAGVVGLPLSGYTAVLLADTAVPLWQATRRSLPPLFVAAALSSTGSLLSFFPMSRQEESIVERLSLIGKGVELVAMSLVERDAARVQEVARPLHEGSGSLLWWLAKGLTAAALAVPLLPRGGRALRVLSATMGTAGALALRFAVFHAGKASARDPRATVAQQRTGRGAAEVTGTSAVVGAGGRRAVGPSPASD